MASGSENSSGRSSPLSSLPPSVVSNSNIDDEAPPENSIQVATRPEDEQEEMDSLSVYDDRPGSEVHSAPPSQKKRGFANAFQKIPPSSAKKAKRADRRWEPEFILTNEKSLLGNANLRDILCHPKAWTSLSKADQAEILALFPDDQHILDRSTPQSQPNIKSLLNDNNFRHDCARYTEDLKSGMHDKEWLAEAWEAHEMRKAGFFDEFQVREFEESWDALVPDQYKPESMRAAAGSVAQSDSSGGKTAGAEGGGGEEESEDELIDEIQVRTRRPARERKDAVVQAGSSEVKLGEKIVDDTEEVRAKEVRAESESTKMETTETKSSGLEPTTDTEIKPHNAGDEAADGAVNTPSEGSETVPNVTRGVDGMQVQ